MKLKKDARQNPQVIYYRDEATDDFAGIQRRTIRIGADFPYFHRNPFWNIAAFVVYRLIMTPFAFLYCKWKFGMKIVNRKALKKTKKQGAFLYSNHTLMAGDAFLPNMVCFPRRTYVVVNADNLSGKGTRNWIQMSGAIPVPNELSGMRAFLNCMEKRISQGNCIQIYPEAHIWPYYKGIRRFGSASFRYPVRFDAPVYCTTTTFSKRKHRKTPRVTVYVDGPFSPDKRLHPREQEKQLCNSVYETMCRRAQNSTYSPIEYVRCEN